MSFNHQEEVGNLKVQLSNFKTEKEEMESSYKAEMLTLQNEVTEEKNKYKESIRDNQRAKEQRK